MRVGFKIDRYKELMTSGIIILDVRYMKIKHVEEIKKQLNTQFKYTHTHTHTFRKTQI